MRPMTFAESATNDHPFFNSAVVMTPLQEQVVRLGKCPNCHTQNLRHGYEGGGMAFRHCDRCQHIWVLARTGDPK